MQIRLLGPIEVRIGEEPVPVGAGKPRALLAMLALHAGTSVSVDRLIEGLWLDGRAPASAAKQIQLYVSQLRKLGLEIVTHHRGYELVADAEAVDALRFERLVRAGEAQAALGMWDGPPLEDVSDEPFAAPAIRHLEDLRLDAMEAAVDAELDAGGHRELVPRLEELVAAHPLRERFHAQRMLALYRSGRQADALEAFHHARAVLMEEVGIEPGRELRDLQERMLAQDPALDPPARARRPAAESRAKRAPRLLLLAGLAAVALGAIVFGATRGGEAALGSLEGNAVGAIDPEDMSIVGQYAIGNEPTAIATGAGAIWTASGQDGTVSRVDSGRKAVTTIDVGGQPTALAYGEGALWVADAATRSLLQIDPRSNRVTRRFAVGNAPRAVAVGFGAVWVASSIDDRVDRVDLATGRSTTLTVPGGPAGVAVGTDAVWVVGEVAGRVARLDPRTGATVGSVAVGASPAAIAAHGDEVWLLNHGDRTLSRIDVSSGAVTDTVPVGGQPVALALGDGDVFVGDETGRLITVDRDTAEVRRTDDVGAAPAALVVDDDALWAAAAPPLAARRGGTVTYGIDGIGCDCLDPASYDATTWGLTTAVYDGLVTYRHDGGSAGTVVVPNLAEGMPESSDGGREYVFRLREGLRYSDGSAVRASDFRSSMERMLRLAVDGTGTGLYRAIEGAAGCTRVRCDLSEGILTDDDARTITIHLAAADPDFLHRLAMPLASVVPADSPMRLAKTEPLPGTGPYRVAALNPGAGGTLERVPSFESWSSDARPDGFPDRIEWTFRSDPEALVEAVRRQEIDVMPAAAFIGVLVPENVLRAFALQAPARVKAVALPQTDWFFLNTEVPPFDDLRVRRAFNLAIDRGRLVELAGGEQAATPTCQIIPPGLPGYEPLCPYTLNPDDSGAWTAPDLARARRLTARAGNRGTPVTFVTFGLGYDGFAEHAARVMRRLGYPAQVRLIADLGRYFDHIHDPANRAQAGVNGWIADYLTATTFFSGNLICPARAAPNETNNASQFCDPQVDAAYQRARMEGGDAWAEVDRLVVDAAPVAPAINRRFVTLISEDVGALVQHPIYGPLLDQTWVR
jgi:ABC-type transport system substrate-binding protein/DNA-binding SARP family transcriptional activator